MGIDSISNAMSFQAQPVISTQPQTRVTKPVESISQEYTDTTGQLNPMVDNTTAAVSGVSEKETGDNGKKGSEGSENKPRMENLKKAIEDLNKKMENSEVLYGIHEGTDRVTIKIVDRQTKEVVKELPAEKTLDMIAKVWEMAGIMVDEKR